MTGQELRELRTKVLGYSQEQFARKIEYTQNYISMVELGKKPVSSKLMLLIKHLGYLDRWEAYKSAGEPVG